MPPPAFVRTEARSDRRADASGEARNLPGTGLGVAAHARRGPERQRYIVVVSCESPILKTSIITENVINDRLVTLITHLQNTPIAGQRRVVNHNLHSDIPPSVSLLHSNCCLILHPSDSLLAEESLDRMHWGQSIYLQSSPFHNQQLSKLNSILNPDGFEESFVIFANFFPQNRNEDLWQLRNALITGFSTFMELLPSLRYSCRSLQSGWRRSVNWKWVDSY